jgi:hypothetical protein
MIPVWRTGIYSFFWALLLCGELLLTTSKCIPELCSYNCCETEGTCARHSYVCLEINRITPKSYEQDVCVQGFCKYGCCDESRCGAESECQKKAIAYYVSLGFVSSIGICFGLFVYHTCKSCVEQSRKELTSIQKPAETLQKTSKTKKAKRPPDIEIPANEPQLVIANIKPTISVDATGSSRERDNKSSVNSLVPPNT